MPPMDTGIAFIRPENPAGRSPEAVRPAAMEKKIIEEKHVLSLSSRVGSGPGRPASGGRFNPPGRADQGRHGGSFEAEGKHLGDPGPLEG